MLDILDHIAIAIRDGFTWLEAHMALVAWLLGWFAALSTSQFAKRLEPPAWAEDATVGRLLQLIACLTGSTVAFALWPDDAKHPFIYAFLVGLSAPLAYDWGRALVAYWRPDFAESMGWKCVQQRKQTQGDDHA